MAVGKVYLVGAGPGDPGLLTLKGRTCLEQADLVLYDGLVNPAILRHSPAAAERTSRVKGPTGKTLDQEQINARLVAAGLEGKTVVRLKGGDPYIFGRGTEEAAALRAAGVPFEVVPGVTAATAAGEYAGVSVTHRKLASAVAFVAGHEDPAKPAMLDYAALANFPGTLVFYMGLARLPSIAESLIKHGKSPDTAACVVSRASRARQQTASGKLSEIAAIVSKASLPAPSLIIIGECATQRESLQWFEQQPLFGKRIAITRATHQTEPVFQMIHRLGGEAVLTPLLEILPPETWESVDAILDRVGAFSWLVFTSANGVRFFLNRLLSLGHDTRKLGTVKIAVVGSSTADALLEFKLKADLVAKVQNAEGLLDSLIAEKTRGTVIWPRGDRGRDVLRTGLIQEGFKVESVVTYRSVDIDLDQNLKSEIESGSIDWIPLASPALAKHLAVMELAIPSSTRLVAISPLTTKAATECGLQVDAEAVDYSWSGMIDAIVDFEES